MEGKRALHAHAVRDAAHGERGAEAFAALADDGALEHLGALLLTLDDPHVHAHEIAGIEALAVLLELSGFNESNRVHDPGPFLSARARPLLPASPRVRTARSTATPRSTAPRAGAGPAAPAMSSTAPAAGASVRRARDLPTAAPSAPARRGSLRAACTAAAPAARSRTTRARRRPRPPARPEAAASPRPPPPARAARRP